MIKRFSYLMLLIISMFTLGCTETVYRTEIKYATVDIPQTLLDPCDKLQPLTAQTNGELLMAYLSLQTAYLSCASKISSISLIIDSYNQLYSDTDKTQPDTK